MIIVVVVYLVLRTDLVGTSPEFLVRNLSFLKKGFVFCFIFGVERNRWSLHL